MTEHKQAIQDHLNILNGYITDPKDQLTPEEYSTMLLTGVSDPKLVGKYEMIGAAKFFEARAMIDGNICLNKTEGMTFPRIKGAPIAPPPPPLVTEEILTSMTSPLNTEGVDVWQADPYINGTGGGTGGGTPAAAGPANNVATGTTTANGVFTQGGAVG